MLTNRTVWWPLCLLSTCLGSGSDQSCTPGACHQLVMGHLTLTHQHRHCLHSVPLPSPTTPSFVLYPPHPWRLLTADMASVPSMARPGLYLRWSGWGAPRCVSLGPSVLPGRGCAALERVNNAPDVLQRAACCLPWLYAARPPNMGRGSWNLWSYYNSLQQHQQSYTASRTTTAVEQLSDPQ